MLNPALFGSSQKSPEQREEEVRQKLGDDFAKTLENMTPGERREFWEQHDRDTATNDD